MKAWTTYKDNTDRKWVITQLFYRDLHSDEVTGCNMYLVGSNEGLIYVDLKSFDEYISKKQMVLIIADPAAGN